jgi:hypothetical protein
MIARSFKSVIWVATVGGAALACYMVSLRVATERADLAKVEHQILAAKREIRMLQTELGTRGRMTQLEDWNSNVLALSAPTSAQFVRDDLTLARLERHDATVADRISADMRMASAETGAAAQPAQPVPPAAEAPKPPRVVAALAHPAPAASPAVLHQASYAPPVKAALADRPRPEEAKRPERHAKAEPVKKPEQHASADGAKKPAEKKLAAARPDAGKRVAAAATPAPATRAAAARTAPTNKLAARGKAVRHPAAAQESDAD